MWDGFDEDAVREVLEGAVDLLGEAEHAEPQESGSWNPDYSLPSTGNPFPAIRTRDFYESAFWRPFMHAIETVCRQRLPEASEEERRELGQSDYLSGVGKYLRFGLGHGYMQPRDFDKTKMTTAAIMEALFDEDCLDQFVNFMRAWRYTAAPRRIPGHASDTCNYAPSTMRTMMNSMIRFIKQIWNPYAERHGLLPCPQAFLNAVGRYVVFFKRANRRRELDIKLTWPQALAQGEAVDLETWRKISSTLFKRIVGFARQIGFAFTLEDFHGYQPWRHGHCMARFWELSQRACSALVMYVAAYLCFTVGSFGQRPQVYGYIRLRDLHEFAEQGYGARRLGANEYNEKTNSRKDHVLELDQTIVPALANVLAFWVAACYGKPLVECVKDYPDAWLLPHVKTAYVEGQTRQCSPIDVLVDPANAKLVKSSSSHLWGQLQKCFGGPKDSYLGSFGFVGAAGMNLRRNACTLQVLLFNDGKGPFKDLTPREFEVALETLMNSGTGRADGTSGPRKYSYVKVRGLQINVNAVDGLLAGQAAALDPALDAGPAAAPAPAAVLAAPASAAAPAAPVAYWPAEDSTDDEEDVALSESENEVEAEARSPSPSSSTGPQAAGSAAQPLPAARASVAAATPDTGGAAVARGHIARDIFAMTTLLQRAKRKGRRMDKATRRRLRLQE